MAIVPQRGISLFLLEPGFCDTLLFFFFFFHFALFYQMHLVHLCEVCALPCH